MYALQLISIGQLGYQATEASLAAYNTDLSPPNLGLDPHPSLTVNPNIPSTPLPMNEKALEAMGMV